MNSESLLVDVGCGQGGFLSYLTEQGYTHCSGVDLDSHNIKHIQKEGKLSASLGSAESLPPESSDILVYNFIFEHIYNLKEAVQSAWSALKDKGYLFVEVPDVESYANYPFFPYYYFAIQEHINHFSFETLNYLFESSGFSLVHHGWNQYNMGSEILNPMVFALYQKSTPKKLSYTHPKQQGALSYLTLSNSALTSFKEQIEQWKQTKQKLYIWGACLELFALFSQSDLVKCNIVAIFDNNPLKIGRSISTIPVVASSEISELQEEDTVILISTIHHKQMQNHLQKSNFKGYIVDISQVTQKS